MITLTSPCCKVEAKYADANSAQYGCTGCGSGFTIEQGKAAAAPAAPVVEVAAPAVDTPADVAPVADAPAVDAAPAVDTPAAQ